MNLQDIALNTVVKKTIELTDQDSEKVKVDVYLRSLPFHMAIKGSEGEETDGISSMIAERVSYSVCDEKGVPLFTKEEVLGTSEKALRSDIVLSLMNLITDFNELSKGKK